MAFQVIERQLYSYSDHNDYLFSFDGPIRQFIIGIIGFEFNWGSGKATYPLASMTLALNVTNVSGNTITLTPVLKMTDGKGNYSDQYSSVTVSVLACINENSSGLILMSNCQNRPIPVADASPITAQTLLTGFSLGFADNTEHNISNIEVNTNLNYCSSFIEVSGNAWMSDNSHHYAGIPKVNAGLILNSDPALASLKCISYPKAENNSSINIPLMPQALFISGFKIETSTNDFPLNRLGVSAVSFSTTDLTDHDSIGCIVNFTDQKGNQLYNTYSYVDLVAVYF
jgi:hypothetical protein